jgi:acetyl-CoA carboxylase biotin carboxylase subunit
MADAAERACRAISYRNAGTIEFLVGSDRRFYFMEMNTRLQVEHPVTEAVTGIDLVREQLRVASGERLSHSGRAPMRGHAIEFRVNAEDPSKGFLPSAGLVTRFDPPLGPGVRVDTHAFTGYRIPPTYDSLLAKVIVHAEDRESCIARSQRALGELNVEGVRTTRDLHLDVLAEARFRLGTYTTSYIEDAAADLPHLGSA